MSLNIESFVLGEISNNTYLVWNEPSKEAAVIDPSFDPQAVIDAIKQKGLKLTGIWLTHGHFDHFIGIPLVFAAGGPVPVYLHPADLAIFTAGGLGRNFRFAVSAMPKPVPFPDDWQLRLGSSIITVRHTPGHSEGHVVFYSEEASTVFTGDLIFRQNVGRTDLPGADQDILLKSIYEQILALPGATRILPGHNEETTVAAEVEYNPYLN
jgi:glyoxylase-like metal-dependent hydrolase (beta-lactamase superfamily II)